MARPASRLEFRSKNRTTDLAVPCQAAPSSPPPTLTIISFRLVSNDATIAINRNLDRTQHSHTGAPAPVRNSAFSIHLLMSTQMLEMEITETES